MPYSSAFIPAEVFMEHNGTKIYHIYKNDDIEQGQRLYHYATTDHGYDGAGGGFDDGGEFDVRNLPEFVLNKNNWGESIVLAIQHAIDSGYFADFPTE